MNPCECGCGREANIGKRFIHGHNVNLRLKVFSQINKGRPKSEEHRRNLSRALKGMLKSEEHRKAVSQSMKKWWANPENKEKFFERNEKISNATRGKYKGKNYEERYGLLKALEMKEKLKEVHKGRKQSEDTKMKIGKSSKEWWTNPENKNSINERNRKISQALKPLWNNPEHIKKCYRGLNARPTKPEGILIDILNKYFPEFRYNGGFNLGVAIDGLIPDFVNVNGRKEVIEVFSKRFHTGCDVRYSLTEEGRRERYTKIGYRCLILWSNDIVKGDIETIVEKISSFRGGD